MVTTKLNLSMTEPQVRQIYAKQGDTGRVLDISLDQTPEDGTLRILRPDGVEVTSEAVTGGEVSGSTFESLTEADVTELTVGIEPVQDLNGYDKPWVGGAGKNLCPNVGWVQGQLGQNGALGRQSYSISSDYIFLDVGTYAVSRSYSDGSTGNLAYHSYNTEKVWQADSGWMVDPFTITVTEPIYIRFTTRKNTSDALHPSDVDSAVKIQLEIGSTATAWQPYSNICSITGHDEVTVTRTGKNLCNATPTQVGTANAYIIIPNLRAGTYTFQCDYSQKFKGLYAYQGSTLSDTRVLTKYNTLSGTFTITQQSDVLINCYLSGLDATAISNIQLELGSTATSYEPYRPNTYTTSLGQTVYGGTLDMVSGVLTVEKAMVTLNGSETWNVNSATSGLYYTTITNLKASGSAVSNAFEQTTVAGANMVNGQFKLVAPNLVNFKTEHATVTDWKTWLSSNNVTVVYPLTTPTVINLTPQQIKTLVGTNNVWASSGDIVNITFTYGGLLSELPSQATEIVGKCYCDIEQNGVSSMPFTLNVKKNERES